MASIYTPNNGIKLKSCLEKKSNGFASWKWKKLCVRLYDNHVAYSKDGDTPASPRKSTSSISQGEIYLTDAKEVKMMDHPKHGFPFQIICQSKNYVFSAESADLRKQWIEALNAAMSKTTPTDSRQRAQSTPAMEDPYDAIADVTSQPGPSPLSGRPPVTVPSSSKPAAGFEYASIAEVPDAASDAADNQPSPVYDYTSVKKKSWVGVGIDDDINPYSTADIDDTQPASSAPAAANPYSAPYSKTAECKKTSSTGNSPGGANPYSSAYSEGATAEKPESTDEELTGTASRDSDIYDEVDPNQERPYARILRRPYSKVVPKILRETESKTPLPYMVEVDDNEEESEEEEETEYDEVEVTLAKKDPGITRFEGSAFDNLQKFLASNGRNNNLSNSQDVHPTKDIAKLAEFLKQDCEMRDQKLQTKL